MAKPVYSLAQVKARLDSGTGWKGATITYAMPDSAPDGSSESVGFRPLGPVMKATAATSFELWDDLIKPSLTQVNGTANITFAYSSTTGGSTYAGTVYGGQSNGRFAIQDADIWFAHNWTTHDQDSDLTLGSYGNVTYLHEIGHALGLDHPGNYDGNADYAGDALYRQDTRRFTVMSYFDAEDDGSATNHGNSYAATPMLHDILAIQAIYGADLTTRLGATTYGFGSTAGRDAFDFSKNTAPVVTIWDAGGRDTLNLSGFGMAQTIDLRVGAWSSIGGLINNLAIAFGTTLEDVIGGRGADRITGNAIANTLKGGLGADILLGLAGNDLLRGGAGKDRLEGGNGIDTAVFAGNEAAYRISERADGSFLVSGGSDGGDILFGIEKLLFADGTVLL